VSSSPPGYVVQAVGDTRFHVSGTVVIDNRSVFLVRPSEPWRADWSTSGLYDDGWTRPHTIARIHVYPYPGQTQPVTRALQVSLAPPAGVTSSAFTLTSNTGTLHGRVGSSVVAGDVTVCVPPRHAEDVRLIPSRSTVIYGDPRSERSATDPRRAGIFVSRIYLSGHIGANCRPGR
jgi:hypothetical protein